jgi:hypothetical protein
LTIRPPGFAIKLVLDIYIQLGERFQCCPQPIK